MSVSTGAGIVTSNLIFYYDAANVRKSWRGSPTTNRIISTPLTLSIYAYAAGPVSTNNVIDADYNLRTVNRYTVNNTINTARAAVYPSGLAINTSYSFSCKIKYNGTHTSTPSFAIDASKGSPEGGANNNTISSSSYNSVNLGNGWYYITYTWSYSACPTGACILTFGVVTGSDSTYLNNTFDVYEPQFEVNSFASPYVTQENGIRGNTQSLIDLTGRNTITVNSLTYNANGTFSFDGSSNFLTLGNDTNLIQSNQITVEAWVKTNVIGSYKKIFTNGNATGVYLSIGPSPYNTYFGVVTNGTSGSATWTTDISTVSYTHMVGTYNGSICRLYVNGEEKASGAASGTMGTGSTTYVSGYASGSERWNGLIPLLKVYNRALTSAEIQQNFNSQRSRYGL